MTRTGHDLGLVTKMVSGRCPGQAPPHFAMDRPFKKSAGQLALRPGMNNLPNVTEVKKLRELKG
jgi:hypothetical protein